MDDTIPGDPFGRRRAAGRADTIGDLKYAVMRLAAKQPVQGIYTVETTINTAGRFSNENTERNISFHVAHDASGIRIRITISQPLIDKASREAQSGSGAWDNTAQRTIGSIRPMSVVEAPDFRGSLLGMLSLGTVAGEKHVTLHGQPPRLVMLKLSQPPRKTNSIRRACSAFWAVSLELSSAGWRSKFQDG